MRGFSLLLGSAPVQGQFVSNRRMNPTEPHDAIDHRLTELEIKASYADDLLDHLNEVVARQQQQIDLLQAQIRELYLLMQPAGPGEARNPRDEIPPHY